MLDEITKTIYPDCCEVIEIESGCKYVYPIFKCGRSSLYETLPDRNWRVLTNQDIAQITAPITVFVRDPRDRFVSGVNTFIQHLLRENDELDVNTILYFVDRYLFLNRHYAPQFFWLIQLATYGGRDQVLHFEPMQKISELTDLNSDAGVHPVTPWLADRIKNFDWQPLELYMFLDQIILDHIGHPISFKELIYKIYHQHPEVYRLIFEHSRQLTAVIDVLPKT